MARDQAQAQARLMRGARDIDRIVAAIARIDVSSVAPELRTEIAHAWADDALGEHASIAAFARFSLELLALGAPPELVARAHEAALDEIEHARCSFAAAARFGGELCGPGPLDCAGLALADVAGIVGAATRDGCVGETASAVIARAELAACAVPALRDALAIIAEDEARHACLAWRFVAWAIAEHGAVARAAFEAAVHVRPEPARATTASPKMAPFGRLDPARRAQLVERVHAAILPARAAWLASPEDQLASVAWS